MSPVADDYEREVEELHAIARRDEKAFLDWLARCEITMRQSLRSFALVADVEAVVQETAIQVWNLAPDITPDGRAGFLLRWACTVARNRARNWARRAGRLAPLPPDPVPRPAPPMPDPFLRSRIRECLSQLRGVPQRAIRARLDDGGAHADRDLAASAGMTFDAFRQNLARGRKTLVECLRSFGIEVVEYLR